MFHQEPTLFTLKARDDNNNHYVRDRNVVFYIFIMCLIVC